MEAIVQHYIGTTAEWMNANPVLFEAVWAFEVTPDGRRLMKVGDGVRPWQTLPYINADNIHGLSETLAELAGGESNIASAVQALQEALAQETTARAQGDDANHAYASAQVQAETALRIQGDNEERLRAEEQLQAEQAARQSLQAIVGQILEFVREQLGPFEPVKLVTQNGFNLVTQDGKSIVTLLDINQI
jgi:hypothetical protein